MKKMLVAVVLLVAVLFCFAACSAFDLGITFMVNGEEYDEVRTNGTETITMPENPKKEGHVFVGWYFDKDVWQKPFTANSLLDTPLTSDIRVYAYFVKEGDESIAATLTFNSMGGSDVVSTTVPNGAKPKQPTAPTYEGFYFCGWYTYPDYQTPFNFDEPLTKDTTVYAKWAQVGSTSLADVDFEKTLRVEPSISFDSIYEQNGKTYVVYKLGTMKNVILGQLTGSVYHSGGMELNYVYGQGSETSIARTVEEVLGATVGMSIEATVEGGPPFAKASFSYTASVSESYSWSEAFTRAEAVYTQHSSGLNVSLDNFALNKYYTLAIVGDQDVYQYFVFDENGYTGEKGITALEVGASSWRVLSSDNVSFTYSGEKKLIPLNEPDLSLIFGGGRGTENAPYFVGNVTQLYSIKLAPDAYYKMTNDINMTTVENWTPICGAAEGKSFSGTINGNGKTIRGLNLQGPKGDISAHYGMGLFGNISGTVKNLKLENCKIEMEANHKGDGWVLSGILCGRNYGVIENVEMSNCSVTVHRTLSHTGGLAGKSYSDSKISGVIVENSTVYSNGDVGMIAGGAEKADISNCEVRSCSVQYYAEYHNRSIGGVVGHLKNSTLSSCAVTDTEFWYKGSGYTLHNYNIFGSHSYCSLQPAMGYIVGAASTGATFNASSCRAQNNTKRFDGAPADDQKYLQKDSSESKQFFRVAYGMAGSVANSTVN